jgi:hypothetical protein
MGKVIDASRNVIGNHARRIPFGKSRRIHVCENNFKVAFKKIGYERMDPIHLLQDRTQCLALVSTVMNLLVA